MSASTEPSPTLLRRSRLALPTNKYRSWGFTSEAFDEKEKSTIRFADIVTRGASAVDPVVLEYVGKHYSEDEIVELTMVIGLANLVNRINDTLQIEPDLG